MSDKLKKLQQLKNQVNKKFGENAMMLLGEKDNVDKVRIKRISTPSVDFNAMLDGGLAKGKIIEFFGPQSSGKTFMAMEIIAAEQAKDPDFVAVWYETENSFDPDQATMIGIDFTRLFFINQTQYESSETAMDVFKEALGTGSIDMAVINSVAGIVPKAEVESDLEKQQVALVARLMSKFMRVTTNLQNASECTTIYINQVRTNIGGYGDPNISTGGLALGFFATQRVGFTKLKPDSNDPIDDTEGIKVGCRVRKNRLAKGNPYKNCFYFARYGVGIDNKVVLPKLLIEAGIFRQSGAWIYYDPESLKWNGKNKLLDHFNDHPDFYDRMVDLLSGNTSTVTTLSADEIKEIEASDAKADQLAGAVVSNVKEQEGIEE